MMKKKRKKMIFVPEKRAIENKQNIVQHTNSKQIETNKRMKKDTPNPCGKTKIPIALAISPILKRLCPH